MLVFIKENSHSCFCDGKIVLVTSRELHQYTNYCRLCYVPRAIFPGLLRANHRDRENACVFDGWWFIWTSIVCKCRWVTDQLWHLANSKWSQTRPNCNYNKSCPCKTGKLFTDWFTDSYLLWSGVTRFSLISFKSELICQTWGFDILSWLQRIQDCAVQITFP